MSKSKSKSKDIIFYLKTIISILLIIIPVSVSINIFIYHNILIPRAERDVLQAQKEFLMDTINLDGHYRSQIEDLKAEIARKEDELQKLRARLAELKRQGFYVKEIELLKQQITFKEEQIKFYKEQISRLNKQLENTKPLIETSKKSKILGQELNIDQFENANNNSAIQQKEPFSEDSLKFQITDESNFLKKNSTIENQLTINSKLDKIFSKPNNQPPPLRKEPKEINVQEVEDIIKKEGFFDIVSNKESKGFPNKFKIDCFDGDTVIVDQASGLMWQQNGSKTIIEYNEIRNYLEDFNKNGYAGFHDWRLPTLEEAMTLLRPKKKNGEMYIDSLFDKTQTSIWTSDKKQDKASGWFIDFIYGSSSLYYSQTKKACYVRCVRIG